MKASKNYGGYHVVTLKGVQHRVHCLVLQAFIGPRPVGQQGCHDDDNPDNNALKNLRWDTPKGNIADRKKLMGESNPSAKLTDAQKAEVLAARKAGHSLKEVAARYGITDVRVSQIARAAA